MTVAANHLISVHSEDLKFQFELEKQSYCDLKITNNTENHVAFKVKTTSPKKYFVRPNTGVMHPWGNCVIRVTLQAQREYPPNMQCKDKFLLQSTIVPPNTTVDDLQQDTVRTTGELLLGSDLSEPNQVYHTCCFNKESSNTVEECKLRVVYMAPHSAHGSFEDGIALNFDTNSNPGLQRLKDERDEAIRQTKQLQQDLEIVKRRRSRKNMPGLSIKFSLLVGLIGITVGFLLNLLVSSPSAD